MRWAVVALNEQSKKQALFLRDQCEDQCKGIDLFTIEKYMDQSFQCVRGGLKAFNQVLFQDYKVIIYVMAMGIIVRDISPWMKHKSVDPAVLCYSVDGRHIIPVLSGHLGGANAIAMTIADATGAEPVITTASDILGKSAVDMMAKSRNLTIGSFKAAKELTAMMINEDKVCLYSDMDLQGKLEGMVIRKTLDGKADGLIYVGYRKKLDWQKAMVALIPKALSLGIGARRDTPYEQIREMLDCLLEKHNIDRRAIARIASIELKADEQGIIELSEKLKVPFVTYTAQTLAEEEDRFEVSSFVKKTTGTGAVAMPSGYLASSKGRCVMEKVADKGITMCLWEERL